MEDKTQMEPTKAGGEEMLQEKLCATDPIANWLEKYRALPRFLGSFRDYCYAMYEMGHFAECYCEVIDTGQAEMFARENANRYPIDSDRAEWLMGKGLAALVDYKQFPDGTYVGTPLKRRK